MIYSLDDIKKDVRVALEENRGSGNIMADVDTLSLDEVILSKIEDAVKEVYLIAPVHLLEPGNNFAESIAWETEVGKGPGWTLLPNDFLRLMAFKMSDWERPVFAAILPDDPLYSLQSSRFAGIRGNRKKPVCAIVMRPQGKALEFYSCAAGETVTVEMAIYIPVPKISGSGINIFEGCYRSVVYKIAGLTASALKEYDFAKALFDISNELLK